MTKIPISIRIDEEILQWFKENNDGSYQAAVLAVLKKHVETKTKEKIFQAGMAQELYRQFYSKCFWNFKKDLIITPSMINFVRDGLKQRGGREGFLLAAHLTVPNTGE